jgi:hypothetical protein
LSEFFFSSQKTVPASIQPPVGFALIFFSFCLLSAVERQASAASFFLCRFPGPALHSIRCQPDLCAHDFCCWDILSPAFSLVFVRVKAWPPMFVAHIRCHLSPTAELICFRLSAHVASHHPRFAFSAHALSGRCAHLRLLCRFWLCNCYCLFLR